MKTIKHLLIICLGLFAFQTADAQINADFTYVLADSCTGWTAFFTDQSGTNPVLGAQYTWDFGDGTTSTQQNPFHDYQGPGTYQVLHTVIFQGVSYTQVETITFITQTPTLNFSVNTSSGSCTGPFIVSFAGTSNQANTTNWEWYANGQFIGSGQGYTHTLSTPGNYTFTLYATGPNGCFGSHDTTFFVGGGGLQVSASYQTLNADCQGALVDLYSLVNGGVPPYTYQWNWYDFGASNMEDPQQVYVLTSIDPMVNLTVTDANGCSGTTAIQIQNNSPQITAGATANPSSSCSQSCDGSIFAYATGSAGPYTFELPNGQIFTGYQAQFDSICPGVYDIFVSDFNGCSTITTVSVFQDSISGVVVDAIVSNGNTCSSATVCSGIAEAVVSNGVAPYQYSIDFGATYQDSATFTGLCPGTYQINVIDSAGCQGEYSFVIQGNQSLGVQTSQYFANCDSNATGGGNNSFISVFAFGGSAPYTYLWSNGSTSSSISNPSPGTYTVLVTDANACTYSETFIVPANDCYTISGNVYVDVNQNCIFDSTDYPISAFVDLTATAGGPWLWIYDYTDANGAYSITAPAGTYFFDINGYYVNNLTPVCPGANYSVTLDSSNTNVIVDFFLAPPPPVQDLSINMYTPYTFTPGFPTYTTVQYCNDGTIPMSGNVVVEYDASLVWYQSGTTPSGYSINNNDVPSSHDAVNHILTYDFSNLQPGQCNYLDVDYETPIGTGLMPGDPILIDATVNPIPGDLTPANNVTYMAKVITSSWDPNDKAVSPGGDITVDENDHAYFIRFQNEGNGNATTVVVRDEIDANLALHSLRNVYATHDYILTIENDNTLVFTFNNIQLVPQSVSETLSQGHLGFTLSQEGELPVGTVINNTAEIFFDFNPPIVTNTVENEIVEKVTGITNTEIANALSVYPNPSTGVYNLKLDNQEISHIRVYDLIGNVLLQLVDLDANFAQINLSNSADGVYFVEVETPQGKAVQKLLKKAE